MAFPSYDRSWLILVGHILPIDLSMVPQAEASQAEWMMMKQLQLDALHVLCDNHIHECQGMRVEGKSHSCLNLKSFLRHGLAAELLQPVQDAV